MSSLSDPKNFAVVWDDDGLAAALDPGVKPEEGRSRNNLKDYWLHGEGAGKWSTWTELHGHLTKHMADGLAKRTAAEWFHERYGIWPGSDANKVAHGKPPRGQVVGPG